MPEHRFEDEWILKAAIVAAGQAAIDKVRADKRPRLADGLLAAGIEAEVLCRAIKSVFHVPTLAEPPKTIDRLAVSLVPERICRRQRLMPVRLADDRIEIAMDNPIDHHGLADVHAVTGREPVALYMPPGQLDNYMARAFDPESAVYDLLERFNDETNVELLEVSTAGVDGGREVHAPVIKLVNSMIARAVHLKASDIHIEHEEKTSAVRLRVDGALRNLMTLPQRVGAGQVVARIKIMADLDISDRLRPQDGRAKLRVGSTEIGLRVSTLPTSFGEKVVMRIIDTRSAEVPFDKLGFRPELAKRVTDLSDYAQGLLLVTGPTGSGKTTSLYSMLNRLKRVDTNIVTIEDPIEFKLAGINQVQVQPKQGLTFASILRSVLRQDPDVILVGEIRDKETADVALQAAQTGHLVLSTLHTNDAVSTIMRLVDMGVERFAIAPGLLGIVAQRLVRRLCPACREELPAPEIPGAAAAAMKKDGLPVRLYKSRGCADCEFSGYTGRVTLVELLVVSPELRQRIGAGDDEHALREFALSKGLLVTMAQDAAARLSDGTTSLDEAAPYTRFSAAEAAPATRPAAPAAAAAAPAAGEGKRVLLIDDDAAIRIIMRTVLQKAGFAVTEAVDGAKGLESLAGETPDIIVVDMHMPNMDGTGVIRGARESLGLSLPILVLSSDAEDKSQIESLRLGADDYVLKPVKPAVLVARVEAALRRTALNRS